MTQCKASPMGGGRCEREEGHEGKHFRSFVNREGGFEWDDESQAKYSSRFD